jgi:hypothetical protein
MQYGKLHSEYTEFNSDSLVRDNAKNQHEIYFLG